MAKTSGKYVVVHPKLCWANSKTDGFERVGTILTGLTESQIERLGSKIKEYVEPPVMSAIVSAPADKG